jgi:pantoate--beta-alanine ligase
MIVLEAAQDIQENIQDWKKSGQRIAFVPTMGALHEGHLSLCDIAAKHADKVVVSIFVNPAQFGKYEDFSTYPRDMAGDLEKLRAKNIHAVYTPREIDIYPEGVKIILEAGPAAYGLESEFRPQFFDGVATVVHELFHQVRPDIAVFGEKDYQQLCVIRQMVASMNMPITIMGGITLRDPNGLALSSRNSYLTPDQNIIARKLSHTLRSLSEDIQAHPLEVDDLIPAGIESLLAAGFDHVDYLELRAENTLKPVSRLERPARLLAAVHLGKTRLIDNWPVSC